MICVKLASCQREVSNILYRNSSTLTPSLSTFPHNLDTVLDIYKNKLLSNPIFIQHELWLTSRPWFAHFGLLLNSWRRLESFTSHLPLLP